MRTKNLLSLFAIVIAIAFVSTNLFAQDSLKIKQKGTEGAVQTQSQFKMETPNKGETTQPKVMNTHQVRVNEGQGTMTREELYGEAKELKGEDKPLKKFVDEDGDGINDNVNPEGGESALKKATKKGNVNKFGGNKYGPGDGTGNDGIGPQDGTGYGPGTITGSASGTKRGSRK